MTAREFSVTWEETESHIRHAARASQNVPDMNPATLENLRRALLIAADVLQLARKANGLPASG